MAGSVVVENTQRSSVQVLSVPVDTSDDRSDDGSTDQHPVVGQSDASTVDIPSAAVSDENSDDEYDSDDVDDDDCEQNLQLSR